MATRKNLIANGADITPLTREELILAGKDITPLTEDEQTLKAARGGGGGGGGGGGSGSGLVVNITPVGETETLTFDKTAKAIVAAMSDGVNVITAFATEGSTNYAPLVGIKINPTASGIGGGDPIFLFTEVVTDMGQFGCDSENEYPVAFGDK